MLLVSLTMDLECKKGFGQSFVCITVRRHSPFIFGAIVTHQRRKAQEKKVFRPQMGAWERENGGGGEVVSSSSLSTRLSRKSRMEAEAFFTPNSRPLIAKFPPPFFIADGKGGQILFCPLYFHSNKKKRPRRRACGNGEDEEKTKPKSLAAQ